MLLQSSEKTQNAAQCTYRLFLSAVKLQPNCTPRCIKRKVTLSWSCCYFMLFSVALNSPLGLFLSVSPFIFHCVSWWCCYVIFPWGFWLMNYSEVSPLFCFVALRILLPQRVAQNLFLSSEFCVCVCVLMMWCTHTHSICKYMLTRPFVDVCRDSSKI